MPAERAGSSPGRAGERGPGRRHARCSSACRSRRQKTRKGYPQEDRGTGLGDPAGNAGIAVPATMEEVAERLPSALLKVASNEGDPGPDGQTGVRMGRPGSGCANGRAVA
jgi:hypothetical protein